MRGTAYKYSSTDIFNPLSTNVPIANQLTGLYVMGNISC